MKPPEVADGVFRLGTKWVNFYLLVDRGEATLIDVGYPSYWHQVTEAVGALGLPKDAVSAAVVTHHHVDHVGSAERCRRDVGATVYVHEADAAVVSGERRSHVPPGFYRQSWRPSMARYLAHTVAAGGARYRPVEQLEVLTEETVLEVAGHPRVIPTPGHTAGHCSVYVEDRGVLFAADAMVNFDYASGNTGLRPHRFNEDRERALASLDRLDGVDAGTVLFGHGDPWTEGLPRALEVVRSRA